MDKAIEKKEKEVTDFYLKVRGKINRWLRKGKLYEKTGKWSDRFAQYLLIFPDLIHLMIKLFMDREISPLIKSYILMVFVYLISPIDVIPDFIPVAGFVDDLLVLIVVLNKIINTAEKEVLEKIKLNWAGEDDIFAKVKEIVALTNELSARIPRAIYNFMKNK
jgi:uncharacterized membrane protein YkvA (DUF1232 family)